VGVFGEERKEEGTERKEKEREGKGRKEGRGKGREKTPMGSKRGYIFLEFSRRVYYWRDTSLIVLVL